MTDIVADDGCKLNAQVEGPAGKPVLMLSNSLGTDLHMWDAQAGEFAKQYRLIRYDRRGHGRSDAPPGPYSMERLGRDALAIMDSFGADKVHWLGLSMGGMVGQWLGANAPKRIGKLILSNTACHYADKGPWNDRIALIRDKGLSTIADAVIARWLTDGFRAAHPDIVVQLKTTFQAIKPQGYIGCCEAIRDMDHREALTKITAPTLVIAGRHDLATPVANSEYMRDRIPGAALEVLDAAHIANIEQPEAYARVVLGFLSR